MVLQIKQQANYCETSKVVEEAQWMSTKMVEFPIFRAQNNWGVKICGGKIFKSWSSLSVIFAFIFFVKKVSGEKYLWVNNILGLQICVKLLYDNLLRLQNWMKPSILAEGHENLKFVAGGCVCTNCTKLIKYVQIDWKLIGALFWISAEMM